MKISKVTDYAPLKSSIILVYTVCSILSVSVGLFRVIILTTATNTGSYRSAHDLLNLLNKLRKSDKMQGLPSILLLFRKKFNTFNNTGA